MIDVPVLVKDALREGAYKKNYRFLVLNDDGTTDFIIDNNNLVKESVSIDERMNSGDKIKFGLCEGASLEFQYFEKPNINSRTLQVILDVQYTDEDWYSIPMGFFAVEKISRQASTGIMKVTAYNKLMSDYLDAKANNILLEDFDENESETLIIYDIQKNLLANYEITERPVTSYPLEATYGFGTLSITGPWYFSQYLDIDTPLSGWEYEHATGTRPSEGTRAYVYASYIDLGYTTNVQDYWNINFIKGDIDVFVSNYLDYITDVFESAQFRKSASGSLYTREEIRAQLLNNQLISVIIYGTEYENYSLTSPTEQPSEVLKRLNKKTHIGEAQILIRIIDSINFKNSYATADELVSLRKAYEYVYYKHSSPGSGTVVIKQETATPDIHFSDGDLFFGDDILDDMFVISNLQLSDAEKIATTIGDMPEFTLRDIVSANYETQCQYGQLDRQTDLFSGVELNQSRLFPQDTLYPAANLHPYGAAISGAKSMYQKLWADEGNIHKWKYLIITYKGLDGEGNEVDKTLQRTINADGTDNYNMSDNWLFRNLVWAAEDVGTYADAMVAKMQDMTWFPFEMWAAGLPYLETGDEIEIPLGEDTYTSYILQRQLKGIQNLQDTYINGTLDIF